MKKRPSVRSQGNTAEMASSDQQSLVTEKLQEEAYEEKHVHEVYQQIAGHFSSTRYKVYIYHIFWHSTAQGMRVDVSIRRGQS